MSANSDLVKLYVNNSSNLEAFSPISGPTKTIQYDSSGGGTFYLGGDSLGNENFSGYVDEVAMWKETLTDDQVTQLYRRGVNRIKFQVRGCYNLSCSGAGWVGPDGTSSSYFSELINNSLVDASTLNPLPQGVVNSAYPSFTFSTYEEAGFSKLQTQYIQYRAVFETDDVSFSPELNGVEIKQ